MIKTTRIQFFSRLFALWAVLAVTASAGDRPELKWKPLEAGFAEAKRTNKKIMIDVYTDWCTWCKRLDRDVYGSADVAEYLDRQYVIIKLNAESKSKVVFDKTSYTEAELAQALGVSGYPTIIFFDSNGEPLDKLGGYVPANEFLPIIKYFGDGSYKTMTWKAYREQTDPPPKKNQPAKK